MDRQDLWALPTSMESFGICVRGLALAAQLLLHPSAVKPAELMDLFRKLGEFYEVYYCGASVASLVEVYTKHITPHFTRLRQFALQMDLEMPPSVSVFTSQLRMALD